MATPRNREHPAVRKLINAGLLAAGSIALGVLAFGLVAFANVPMHAATIYAAGAAASILVAFMVGVPWGEAAQVLSKRASGNDGFELWVKDFARRASKIRAGLRPKRARSWRVVDLGLWVPFVLLLGAVGSLIHLSGGIVHSPFAPIPAVVLTLVVLLIGPPETTPESTASTKPKVMPEEANGELPSPTSILVLFAIAFLFYIAMIALNIWVPNEAHVSEGAILTVAVTTTVVGVTIASLSRWAELTGSANAPTKRR